MRKEKERYSYGGYKYAPESINFTLNGKRLQLPDDLRSNLAYLAICGRHKEVLDGLKRFVRKERRTSNVEYVTYGFYRENGKDFYYTRDLLARPSDMQDKVRVYKKWKQYLKDNNCIATCYTVESGAVAPDGTSKPSVRTEEVRVDLSRPVRIKLVRKAVA